MTKTIPTAMLAAVLVLGAMIGPADGGEGGRKKPTPKPTARAGAQSAWRLHWEYNFDGPAGARPDAAKWTVRVVSRPANNELQYYTDRTSNVATDGKGHLVITARKERYRGRRYTSGRMDSTGKFDVTYGRFEARIKMSYGQGIWPAFWLLGSNFPTAGWPSCGEIDIMENIGRELRTVHGTLHGPGYSGGGGVGGSYKLARGRFADEFHPFAVEWEPNVIRWYVDGKLSRTRTPADLRGRRWVFDHNFYIILNLAVGGDWPGAPNARTVFPQTLTVDYVRVYRRPDGYAAATPSPTPAAPKSPNLALRRPVASSSNENPGLAAGRAVDGKAGTRWASAFRDPQWLRIDLGKTQDIKRVVLRWEAAHGRSYQIQTSDAGKKWTTIHRATKGAGGVENLSVSGRGRYIRLYGTARATRYGYSLWEFEVYGPDEEAEAAEVERHP